MEKHFKIEHQNEELQPHYKDQILKIINDYEIAIRAVSPGLYLDEETHHEEKLETKEEWREYEKVRKDVCESFGVIQDDQHVFIYDKEIEVDQNLKQRSSRAFCVVIDAFTNENENRSKISISTESKEEADRIFNGLSAGGEIEAPIGESPWGTYFGMFRDKYGIEWMVEFGATD